MKKNAYIIKAMIFTAVIMLLTVTAGVSVLNSSIWEREKYTLAVTVIAIGTAVIYPALKRLETDAQKAGFESLREHNALLERKAAELNRALKNSEQNIKELKESVPEYKRKSEVLESYRNSFPCLVQPGYTVFNVIRTEVVPDKYSRWLIVGEFGDELWKTTIIRRDMQTYGEMLTLISKTETPDSITKLNEQNALPWE